MSGLPFGVIPARFERATRSLEGCCSIQLSYGTIGKTAPCGDDLRRKDRKSFSQQTRRDKKSHVPQGQSGRKTRQGAPQGGKPAALRSHQHVRQTPMSARHSLSLPGTLRRIANNPAHTEIPDIRSSSFPGFTTTSRRTPYRAEKQPVAPIFRRIILPGGIFCLHLQA